MFKFQKVSCIILTFFLLISVVLVSPVQASAKSSNNYISIMHKISTARPNFPVRYNFSLEKESDIYFDLAINERTTIALTIKNQRDEVAVKSDTLPFTDPKWQYNKKNGIYNNKHTMHLPAGDYILEMNFENEVNYDMNLSRISETAKLNYTKLDLTKGFSRQLKVDGGKIKSCSSSKKNVATVTNSGKITAKKNGKTTIKVHLTNGTTLSCPVTVKSNEYKAKKIEVKDVVYNTSEMKAYNASFDAKGNLVLKFKLVNNSYGKITNISKFKVTVTDSSKKKVVSYSKKNYAVNIASYSDKEYAVTIPKSALKKSFKKIDLRTSKIRITGKFASASL